MCLLPQARRVLQAVLYETAAILLMTPFFVWAFAHPMASAFVLSSVMSAIALAWNYLFNSAFERWEAKQHIKGRSFARRLAHGVGFEGGLTVLLVPLVAVWLDISFVEALTTDAGILAFFFAYTVAFTWTFDRVFGLPQSARGYPPLA